jgi:SAM-dependent methyltransferase
MLSRLRNKTPKYKTLFVGFGVPYANKDCDELLLMQAQVGIFAWPDELKNRASLAYENDWPFLDQSFDEILIIHGMEYAQHAGNMLAEAYRCLRAEGRLIVIVPNRRGVWVRSDKTPFGFGEPYTLTQLSSLLKKSDFVLTDVVRGLYSLPSKGWFGDICSWIFNCIASRTLQKFSGLVGVKAVKRVYAGIPAKKIVKENPVGIRRTEPVV